MSALVERPQPAVDLQREAEVRAAARALLRRPLLRAGTPDEDDLRLVRRHRTELAKAFSDGLGYRVVVEPTTARLLKSGLGRDATRPLRRRSGRAFTPRAYALLTLTVAALTRARPQLMVDELVAAVRSAAAEAGVSVDLDAIADRRALHAALLALCDLGVLTERDGDLEHWVDQQRMSLLDVHHERLALLVAAPLGACRTLEDLLTVTAVPSTAGGARVAVRRRLAEQPVLSHDDLTEEQLEWWRRNRNRERDWFRRVLGLEVELRGEGAVAIDPDGELTDVPFPGGGSARHFALLLLDALVAHVRAARPARELSGTTWVAVDPATVRRLADAVLASWRSGFKKAHREDPAALLEEALGVLEEMGLVRRSPSLELHACASRFVPRPELVAVGGTAERSLFDEDEP
ncbi:MAG TPA: TIGR02678 family protein [Dermatophilaceae bacterium]|nr:TIGR02678 family protein [Dermatophilaceae bacterium]